MTEQLVDVEEDTIELPEPEEPKPVEKQETLRETIEKARESVKQAEPKEKKVVKVKSHERVVSKDLKEAINEDVQPVIESKPVAEVIAAPQAYSGAVKAKWAELPKEIQQELSKREQDFHRELTKHDEERNFGRQIDKIITPYIAQIRAEGATAPQAIESLLNMAHVLRVGNPQQKSELLIRTAQTFGVDLRQALQGQTTQQQLSPQVQNVLQEVQGIKQRLEQQEALKKQQEDADIQEQIKAFSEDPKNIHFETVKPHMAALLQGAMAKNLQDAYDQAVYANPQTRSALLSQQAAEGTEKRVAEQKARLDAAKKAGSSLKGSPGIAATKNGKITGLDLRSTIKAAMSEHMEG